MSAGLDSLTRVAESSSGGDVVGPSSAVNNRIAVFDGTTGKLIKDGGSTIADIVAGSGGLVTSVFGRTGAIVAATNDYNWSQIDKTVSSLADITTRSAADLNSGTLAAARMPALTGDVTTSAGSVSTTIGNNVVTLAKLADIATASFLGRNTAGTGDPEVLSVATVKTMLGLTGTNSGDVTLAGETYLSLAGQVITANPINLSGTHVTSTLPVSKGGTGTGTTFTAGSVLFAGASGVYAQDNANLFFDDTNNRLGVGVAAPQQPLHVKGSNPSIRIEDSSAPNIGDLTVTSDFVGFGANRDNVTGARFNTGKTTASIFMLATNANSAITFGTTPTNNTDPIQRMLIDKDGKVLIGPGSPSQLFEVTGNVFVNAATANLFLKDISTGWQSSSSTVVTPQANNHIRSTNYTSGLIGWNISAVGNAEFNNVDVRGAIHAALIVYNAIAATAGTLGVFKSAAKLRTDVTVPSGPTYGTTTVNVDVVDPDGLAHASSQVFAVNDILRLKDGLVGDTWLKVQSASDQTTFWRYVCIIMAGSNNVTYRAGLGVADYGLSGQGFIIQTADQTNSPYLQMATHPATFTSNNAAGTLNVTPRLRIGNLNGSYGYATDTYGFGTGQYGAAGQSWITVDSSNGVRIGNNVSVLTQVDAAGNASFIGSITSSSGTIGGWTISGTSISKNEVKLAAGVNISNVAGTGEAWFGKSASDGPYYGLFLKGTSGAFLDLVAGQASIGTTGRPYLQMSDGTRARVLIGELNTSAWDGVATNSMGMKIWSSAGVKLVEFSDAQNVIAGWAVTATSLSSGTGATTVAMDSGGTNPAFYAGSATPASAPFRVTNAGALTATNATITGAIAATSGSLSALSITGLLTMSGAASAITIGTTPPTSASAGTGVWLDRTGLYGLLAGTAQAKLDATTGALVAGAGNVTLNADGINLLNGTATANRIKWFDSSRVLGEINAAKTVGTGTFFNFGAHSVGTGTSNNAEITSLSLFTDNSNTNGGGVANFDINVHGPAHATRPNQQVMYLTWQDGGGTPALTGGVIVGPNLGFTTGLTASAALEVRSTLGAFLLPRMTTTQRDALTATDGMMVYNTSTNKVQARAAGAWVDLH